MSSFGSAAYTADKRLIATFEVNLETLPDAAENGDTMRWWATQPDAWAECRQNLQTPEKAMSEYVAWLKAFPESLCLSAILPDSTSSLSTGT